MMKGKILDFSIQTNSGIITGEDNKRYHFNGSEWKEQSIPQRGTEVDFDHAEDGQATSIYLALDNQTVTPQPAKSLAQPQSIKHNHPAKVQLLKRKNNIIRGTGIKNVLRTISILMDVPNARSSGFSR